MKKLKIKGVIISNDIKWIYEYFEIEATTPKDVERELEQANGDEIELEINSGGGDAIAGSEIYSLLKDYSGKVTAKILGIAASAASVIAMAAEKVLISPTAQIMIHNVSTRCASGDYRDMDKASEVLKNYNVSIANAYMLKTGLGQKELLDLMNNETWMTAQRALELKFADEIMFDQELKLSASATIAGLLPEEVINKMKNQRIIDKKVAGDVELAKAKLNLLKIGGVN